MKLRRIVLGYLELSESLISEIIHWVYSQKQHLIFAFDIFSHFLFLWKF